MMKLLRRATLAALLVLAAVVPAFADGAANHGVAIGTGALGWRTVPAAANTKAFVGNGTSSDPVMATVSGDCSMVSGAFTCTKTNGSSFATVATSGSASDLGTGTLPNARLDAEVQCIAGLTSAADKVAYYTGSGTCALADFSSALRTLITTASSANLRAMLTDESGTGLAYFQGGDAGTPSAIVLTNGTGLPVAGITASTSTALGVGSIELGAASDTTIARVSAGVASVEGSNILTAATGQPLASALTSWAAITRASGFDTFAATPSSANLRALLTDEVGTGAAYFVGGALGTPASGTATNLTGLPISGITGLGTGVGTALAVNVGSAGAPVVLNGAGGTPSSLTLTNATGLPLTGLASQAADTVVLNASGSSAAPTAVAMPTSGTNGCAGTTNALTYNTTTHALGCNSIAGAGTGTVTNTGGNLTANAVVLGAGTVDTKVVAGIATDGTSKVVLGVAGSSVGSVDFKNATSGTLNLAPPTGALSGTLTLPNATDTLVGKATTDTLTNKTLTSPVLTTPALGTPASGVLTSTTGYTVANLVGDTTTALGVGSIELGNASDTTIARSAAGIISVEGVNLYAGIPNTSKSAAYTLVLGDANTAILHPASDANNRAFTIPANSSVAYPVNTTLSFINLSANSITIPITTDTMTLIGSGATGTRTLAQYGYATAQKITSTTWIIMGINLT